MNERDLNLNNGWVSENPTYNKLLKQGYSVGGYTDKGVVKYALYRLRSVDEGLFKYETVHVFDTPEEINMAVKLLVG